MKTLLTVDFDWYVNDQEQDWQHSESHGDALQMMLWTCRAADLLRFGHKPEAMLEGEPGELFEHLAGRGAYLGAASGLYVADSHAYGARWVLDHPMRGAQLVNLDAHHDLGYGTPKALNKMLRDGKVECGSWARAMLRLGIIDRYRVVYPAWKGASELEHALHPSKHLTARQLARCSFDVWPAPVPLPMRVESILLVRSGAWSPPWLDGAWLRLVRAAEETTGLRAEQLGDVDVLRERPFDMRAARRMAEATTRAMNLPHAGTPGIVLGSGSGPQEGEVSDG